MFKKNGLFAYIDKIVVLTIISNFLFDLSQLPIDICYLGKLQLLVKELSSLDKSRIHLFTPI